MIAAGELEDPVPPGRCTGEAHGGHRRLGPGGDEAHLLDRRDRVGDLARQLDLGLGRGAEAGAAACGLDHRLDGRRVGVAEDQRAPGHHPVDVTVPLRVLEVGAAAAAGEQGLLEADGAHRADGRVDAARDQLHGSPIQVRANDAHLESSSFLILPSEATGRAVPAKNAPAFFATKAKRRAPSPSRRRRGRRRRGRSTSATRGPPAARPAAPSRRPP